jgi:hypothetical protein
MSKTRDSFLASVLSKANFVHAEAASHQTTFFLSVGFLHFVSVVAASHDEEASSM